MWLNLLVFVAVVGLIVWLLSLLPLPAPFQKIILVVGVIAVVVRLLTDLFGFHLNFPR